MQGVASAIAIGSEIWAIAIRVYPRRVKLKISAAVGPITLRINHEALGRKLTEEIQSFWTSNFLAGRQADGAPLPLNKEGKPLGLGSGMLARTWRPKISRGVARRVAADSRRTKNSIAFLSLPHPGRRRLKAVMVLRSGRKTDGADRRRVRWQSLDGASAKVWEALVRRHLTIAMKQALRAAQRKAARSRA